MKSIVIAVGSLIWTFQHIFNGDTPSRHKYKTSLPELIILRMLVKSNDITNTQSPPKFMLTLPLLAYLSLKSIATNNLG